MRSHIYNHQVCDLTFRLLSTLSAILLFSAVTSAQSLNCRNFDPRAGLSSSETYHAIQDSKGYLWFASDAGVNRFDGREFKKFTTDDGLADNTVFNIYEDHRGRIWFFTFSGEISYYQNNKIYNIAANDSLKRMNSYQSEVVVSFHVDSGDTLWVSYNRKRKFIKILPAQQYRYFELVDAGSCKRNIRFVGSSPQPMYTSDEYITESGCLQVSPDNNSYILNIQEVDQKGVPQYSRIFAKSRYEIYFSIFNVLYKISGNKLSAEKPLPGKVTGICTDRSGNLWIGVHQDGVYRYAGGDLGKEPRHYFDKISVTHVLEDHEGGFWFTTLENGVYYTPSVDIRHLDLPNEDQSITTMSVGEKALFAGTANGKVLSIVGTDGEFTMNKSFSAEANKNEVLTDTYKVGRLVDALGMAFFDEKGNERKIFPGSGNLSFFARERFAGEGFVFASLYNIFYCDDKGRVTATYTVPVRINCLEKGPSGALYIGCMNGLWLLEDQKLIYLGDSHASLKYPVKAMHSDPQGNLWICTKGGGVIRRAGNKYTSLNSQNTLLSNNCTGISEDPQGRMWIASNEGLFVLDLKKNTINKYNVANGLRTSEIKTVRCFNDYLFVGTALGIDYFPLTTNLKNNTPPPVSIDRIQLDERTILVSDSVGPFPYNRNDIEFSFTGFTFKSKEKILYRYKLDGYDSDWKQSTNESVEYTNLPPGRYFFSVQALNNDGVTSADPAQTFFIIEIPWWQQTWLITTAIILFVVMIFLGAGWFISSLKARQEKKARLEQMLIESRLTALRAQMNPHFIFNVINSIQHFILLNDKESAYNYLARFSRLIRMVLDNSRFTTITLDKEIQLLTLYIELEKLRFENEFDFSIIVKADHPKETLSLPNMLIQPFLENAIIHGIADKKERGKIEVQFIQEGNILKATISDNGVGRKRSREARNRTDHNSVGMLITAERLKMIGEFSNLNIEVKIIDLEDKNGSPSGTKVELTIPIM